ncbi:MAG: hypothetical protein FDX21_07930 [Chlorobium sp.]|nr:MAG: hypothetical protein FDX21_07930 [Chlorobium sp.]
MDVEALTLGTPDADSFAQGGAVYYRVDVAAGETLRLNFDRAATDGRTELFVSYGTMPSRSDFDYRYNQADSPDQSIVIANTRGGTYYVMAYNASGATDTYSVTADTLHFSITEIGTTAGSNKGDVTVCINGAELTTHTTAMLVGPDGAEHEASKVYWKDNTEVWATFDLRELTTNKYDVKLQDGTQTVLMADSFTVNSGEIGHVEYGMDTPSALRAGQVGSVRVYYQNLGETDAVAPLLTISGNALLKLPGDAGFGGTSLQLLGINDNGPAGILSPGAHGSFQLFFKPAFAGVGTVNLGVSSLKRDQVIDWNTILEASKPENITQESWSTIKASLITELGATTTDYQNNLAANATYLDQLESRTANIAKLFSLDYQKASDGGTLQSASVLGVLGYSHPFIWDITAIRQSDGSVIINSVGEHVDFKLQYDGSYKLVGQGTSTLTETGGAFVLHKQNGITISFNLDGNFSEIRDSNGYTVQAIYDAGHLTQVVSDNGDMLSFTYNDAGRLIQQTDQAGRTVTFAYDGSNQLLTSVTTLDGTTEYSYVTGAGAALHRISTMTLADGTVHHFNYASSGRLVQESVNSGAEAVTYSYIGVNEVVATDATGASTHLWLNESGQIAQVEDALGNVSQLRYDANGNMTGIVNADGTSTSIQYDTAGHPISVQDALGQTVSYSYDAQFAHLAQVTDQRGNPIEYSYDSQGNLNRITYADGHSESYSYDTTGHLTADVNRNGQSVTYTYDTNGYITQKNYADGTTAKFTYDGHGNLVTAVDADSSTSFQYDTADRLTKVTDGDGRWLSYQYDAVGHRTQMADQAGHITNYSYDTLGHLSRVTDGTGNLIAAYSYDAAGHLNRGDNGNGTYTTYEYDAAGQLTHLLNYKADSTINSRFDYTYDVGGHRTSETTLDGKTSYEYDAIGQLTGVMLSTGRHIAYHYDAAGNRTVVDDGGVATNYATNNLNEYTGVGNAIYSYDANGNLTGKSENGVATLYAYDAENHLLSVTTPSDTWNYEYDALGNRIASAHNGARTEYQLDPTGLVNVAGEYDGNGNLIAAYTYGLGLESQTTTVGGSYYYDYNAIGSTAGLTGSAGSYLNQYSYLPFGENLTTAETVANSFEYVGQWGVMDAGNGLDFMRARYYSGADGRFILTDPLGVNGGDTNLYVYSFNNPNSFIDPSGNLSTMAVLQTAITARDGAYTSINSGAGIGGTIGGAAGAVTGTAVGEAAGRAIGREAGIGLGIALGEIFAGPPGGYVGAYIGGYMGGYIGGEVGGKLGGKVGQNWGQSWGDKIEQALRPRGDGSNLGLGEASGAIPIIRPSDPNDIVGPQSFGDEHWSSSQNVLPYTIHYENQASATAPAQEVTITQTLDSDLNASSFRLGDFGWSDIYIDVPDGTSFYIDRINLTSSKGYMVDVMAGIDVAKHEAYWMFTTIDPTTGEIPVDPTIGFLPTNVTKGTGEGFVNYTVRANADAPTGTVIDAKATIVFTTQEPIDTPAISNTLDTQAPESKVEAMASATVESAQFLVRWSGSDVGSAIAGYTVYLSDNGGTYTPWLENTTLTEATYAGQPGHTYAFYTVATDNAGNKEAVPDQEDLTIQVSPGATLTDTLLPQIEAVVLSTDGIYAEGHSFDFTIRFSESLFVDIAALPPVINMTIGGCAIEAAYQSGSGTDTLIFRHIIADGESNSDGTALGSAMLLNGATLRDIAGNPLVDISLAVSIPINNSPTGSVTITGTPLLGETLTASHTLADADGLGVISYQWQADDVNINGATENSYALSKEEIGKTITVVASYTDDAGTPESVESLPTKAVAILESGVAQDGYLANALLWVDGNNNGLRDWTDGNGDSAWDDGEGEAWTLTDNAGHFSALQVTGTLRITANPAGGTTDISTGIEFTGSFSAPAGSTVVNPLTTLLVAAGGNLAQVNSALGLEPGLDLTTYDPLAVLSAGGTSSTAQALAVKAQSMSLQIANIISIAVSVVHGAGVANANIAFMADAIASSLLAAAGAGTVNLADNTVIANAILSAVNGSVTDPAALANIISNMPEIAEATALLNSEIAAVSTDVSIAAHSGGVINLHDSMTSMTAAQIVAQDTLAHQTLQAVASNNSSLITINSGTVDAEISAATPEVGTLAHAPTITGVTPVDGAANVAVDSDLLFTFSDSIQRGNGLIEIHRDSVNGSVVESYHAETSANLSISDKTLVINPTGNLAHSTHYYVTFEDGSIKGLLGDNFAGANDYDLVTGADPYAGNSDGGGISTGAMLAGVGALGVLAWVIF